MFLPLVVFLYSVIRSLKAQNAILIVFSLVFYAYGEPVYVLLMIASTIINYSFGLVVGSCGSTQKAKRVGLVLAIIANLGILFVFKYSDMAVMSINRLVGIELPLPTITLPVGISFFTFQAMSYVVDVYRGEVDEERNYFNVLLYISFFPQLIAGPIVKYHDINEQIHNRRQTFEESAYGLRRFFVGLAKKVLLADQFALVCDSLYASPIDDLNILSAWLAAFAYMLQIYFDFSGYSDMAIGLGHVFGFTFKENFNYPYKSKSITEFWRRWHISLSTWFLEYVYIPLGGNRKGKLRTCFNKVTVFFLCGLWHGASWTFVAWGLYHGFFLLLEVYVPQIKRLPSFVGHLYATIVVIFGWVLFRADSFTQALNMMNLMVTGFSFTHVQMAVFCEQLSPMFLTAFVFGVFACFPLKALVESHIHCLKIRVVVRAVMFVAAFALAWICVLEIASGSYSPFIYFRF